MASLAGSRDTAVQLLAVDVECWLRSRLLRRAGGEFDVVLLVCPPIDGSQQTVVSGDLVGDASLEGASDLG